MKGLDESNSNVSCGGSVDGCCCVIVVDDDIDVD